MSGASDVRREAVRRREDDVRRNDGARAERVALRTVRRRDVERDDGRVVRVRRAVDDRGARRSAKIDGGRTTRAHTEKDEALHSRFFASIASFLTSAGFCTLPIAFRGRSSITKTSFGHL